MSRLLAVAVALSMTVGVAQAHSPVRATSPKRGSVAPQALRVVTVTFKAKILGGSLVVRRDGRQVSAGRGAASARQVRATLAGAVEPGRYRASWRAVASDGHLQKGSFSFRVR